MSGGTSGVKTFEVFLDVGIWSRLCGVGLLFFGSCCLFWILSHCNGCGVPIVRLQIIPCHKAMKFLPEERLREVGIEKKLGGAPR